VTRALFDTNILIDCLKHIPEALAELKRYKEHAISVITRMEVLAGAKDYLEERQLRKFLLRFALVPLNEDIADLTVSLRRHKRLKVPDAIILASAQYLDVPLITRNTRDFQGISPLVLIPYRLH
jgi:predicted nucleic acid-binding protein